MQMVRKLLSLSLLATLLLAAWLFAAFPDHAREYRLYLMEDRAPLILPFDQVSQEWTEDDIKRRFSSLAVRCYDNRPGEYLGTRSCFADIGSFNGHPAMNASFYLTDGRLSDLAINVPWWAHGKAFGGIVEALGLPLSSQDLPYAGVRLHGWKLANGSSLFYNRDRPLNPLEWSGIHWRSERVCQRQRCWAQ